MPFLLKPRYEAKALPNDQREPQYTWGLFDSYTQEFVAMPETPKGFRYHRDAILTVTQRNKAYERTFEE